MIGKVVGNYKIIQSLGEGGVGMVYKGVDTMLDREVAIKVLRPELASQTGVVERFRSEAVTLAKLSHPNIATLYSLFRQSDDLFMVLEFINGETLDQILRRRRLLPADEAVPVFCQALEGINYAHELGIVHRDIKPGNMMLTDAGLLKVLDFGIARLLGTNRMTRVGNVIGTLEYMSPEQVRGLETDARSDIYGLGIMLYEILTGQLPFESENDFELMKMQTEKPALPPRMLNPDIPAEVERLILRAIEKNPAARFQSAGEFLEAFMALGFASMGGTLGFGTAYGMKRNSRPSNPGVSASESVAASGHQMPPPAEAIMAAKVAEPDAATLIIKPTGENTAPPTTPQIKGTRLASPRNVPEPKETRLGALPVAAETSAPTSFLSGLSWVHYSVAGVGALFLFTLLSIAAVIPFVWTSGEEKQPNSPANKPTVKPPDSVSTTPTPVISVPNEPVRNQETADTILPPSASPVPIDNNPPIGGSDPQSPPPSRSRETAREAGKPAAPAPAKPKDNKPARKPEPKKPSDKRLVDILTDN